MSKKQNLKKSEIARSRNQDEKKSSRKKTYSQDEFMGAYLRGELELKPDGKVKRTGKAWQTKRHVLVPKNLRDIPKDVDVSKSYRFFHVLNKHGKKLKRKDGKPRMRYGWTPQEWRDKGYFGGLVDRHVNLIEKELASNYEEDNSWQEEFEKVMLASVPSEE